MGGFFGGVPGTALTGWKLLDHQTVGAVSEVDFVKGISAACNVYMIVFVDVILATVATSLNLEVSTDGGATYDTTSGHYAWHLMTFGAAVAANASDVHIQLINNAGSPVAMFKGIVEFFAPASSGTSKAFLGRVYNDSIGWLADGRYTQSTAFNGFRLRPGAGNFVSGDIYFFGLGK